MASFRFKKRFGQHILKSEPILHRIVESANLYPGCRVLEVGPGTGNLTKHLLDRGCSVFACELDERMVRHLEERFRGTPNLVLAHADILKAPLPAFDVCVANVPYQISSPLMYRFLSGRLDFHRAILMFQEEFARRLYAPSNSSTYSRLSVSSQVLCHPEQLFAVPPSAFVPPPKVDSRIVRVSPRAHQASPTLLRDLYSMLRLIFSRGRRTLRASMRNPRAIQALCGAGAGTRATADASDAGESQIVLGESFLADFVAPPEGAPAQPARLASPLARLREDVVDRAVHIGDVVPDVLSAVLEDGGWDSRRAMELTPKDCVRLLEEFHVAGLRFALPHAVDNEVATEANSTLEEAALAARAARERASFGDAALPTRSVDNPLSGPHAHGAASQRRSGSGGERARKTTVQPVAEERSGAPPSDDATVPRPAPAGGAGSIADAFRSPRARRRT